jgi:ribosomal protein S18 acetylase RimI-like enzyme
MDASESMTITRLMVHPEHLREGIGASLVEYILDSFAEMRRFKVTAGTKKTPAVALYRKFGFVPEETVKSSVGVDLTLFHLNRQSVEIYR